MQKITPFLWFNTEASDAMNHYVSSFPNSKVISNQTMADGKTTTCSFTLDGLEIMAMNAEPATKMNPTISFFVNLATAAEVDALYAKMSEGAEVLMPLDKYDFSEKYVWFNDKFGVSWQIGVGDTSLKIRPSMLFVRNVAGKAEEAMKLYTSIFNNSSIGDLARYPAGGMDKEGTIMYGEFVLEGQNFIAMDSAMNHQFDFSEGISFFVKCKDQVEVDKYWNALTADGGEESMCGWLKDKFGVSWQIIPDRLMELMSDPNPEKAKKVMDAMLQMKKIIVADLEKAVE